MGIEFIPPKSTGGGGGSAPTDASYVVMGLNATLTQERVLTAGSDIAITDGGAGGNVTVAASPSNVGPGIQVAQGRIVEFYALNDITADKNLCNWGNTVTGNTSQAPATTNYRTQFRRTRLTSGNTVGSVVGIINSQKDLWLGNGAGLGGFYICWRFAVGQWTVNNQFSVGVGVDTLTATGNPSAFLNCILLAADGGDSNLSIMHNDGSGVCTEVALGASYPVLTADDVYRFELYCAANATEVLYKVTKENAGISTSGTLSSNLPNNATFLGAQAMIANGYTGGTGPWFEMISCYGFIRPPA